LLYPAELQAHGIKQLKSLKRFYTLNTRDLKVNPLKSVSQFDKKLVRISKACAVSKQPHCTLARVFDAIKPAPAVHDIEIRKRGEFITITQLQTKIYHRKVAYHFIVPKQPAAGTDAISLPSIGVDGQPLRVQADLMLFSLKPVYDHLAGNIAAGIASKLIPGQPDQPIAASARLQAELYA
jgi:hypothetical protein